MEHESFDSSVIRGAGYDAATQTLEIEFRNHRRYRYLGVPPATWTALRDAPSVGAYFTAHIRNDYECWRFVNAARGKHRSA